MGNRLASASSPYLQQHATNPVAWYPWCDEALEEAQRRDQPILLSIGYATCHWCHVMARESFEDPHTAALMNAHFVCIKVDREERPDLDEVYLDAVTRMTGSSGWPLTVFLTPSGAPFFGGMYFPRDPKPGTPAFRDLLAAIGEAWTTSRARLLDNADRVTQAMHAEATRGVAGAPLDESLLSDAWDSLLEVHDPVHGGFGTRPKFPRGPLLGFVLAQRVAGRPQAGEVLERTLWGMARGAVHDHVGGGFHRYAADHAWQEPHFEKTLPDNAMLARRYCEAWAIQREPAYREIATATLDYLLHELRDPRGGFYSGQDAESAGVEGGYYLWSRAELLGIVGGDVARYYGASYEGDAEHARPLSAMDQRAWSDRGLRGARAALWEARRRRPAPMVDTKIVTSWNALAIHAFAMAGSLLRCPRYIASAEEAGQFLLDELRDQHGRWARYWRDGARNGRGYLDDHAALGLACLALHEATGAAGWLEEALDVADAVVDLFWDEGRQQVSVVPKDVRDLPIQPSGNDEVAMPSARALAADLLLRIGRITGDDSHRSKSVRILTPLTELAKHQPERCGHALFVLQQHVTRQRDVVIVGEDQEPRARALLGIATSSHAPNTTVAVIPPELARRRSIVTERQQVEGVPTAYVCEGFSCNAPVTEPQDLAQIVKEPR